LFVPLDGWLFVKEEGMEWNRKMVGWYKEKDGSATEVRRAVDHIFLNFRNRTYLPVIGP
jgi:hypothetical protein